MKDTQRRRKASFHRTLGFVTENPPAPLNASATSLIAQLTTTATTLDELAAEQDLAFGTVHGAVGDRQRLKKDLIAFLKELGETARVLDPDEHPGLAAEMRLGRATDNYSALAIRARAAHAALVDSKAAFVDLGSPTTVDADLLALISSFEAATSRKNLGKAIHIGGTAGIASLCRTGVTIVRKLDAILSKVYKSDPVLLAGWKAARRVERAPVTVTPPDEGTGSGTGDTGSGSGTPPASGS